MSGAYSLFRLQPIHVHGKGEVAPEGYVSDAQREMMEAALGGTGAELSTETSSGQSNAPAPSTDPWRDLR